MNKKINWCCNTQLFVKIAGNTRKCLYFNDCGQTEIHNGKRWKFDWYKHEDGYICEKHRWNLVSKFRRTKESIKKTNSKRLHFLNKNFRVNPNRKGYCSICPNNLYDGSCKKTDKHHYFYIPIMVWACTEELCASCHAYETWRQRKQGARLSLE